MHYDTFLQKNKTSFLFVNVFLIAVQADNLSAISTNSFYVSHLNSCRSKTHLKIWPFPVMTWKGVILQWFFSVQLWREILALCKEQCIMTDLWHLFILLSAFTFKWGGIKIVCFIAAMWNTLKLIRKRQLEEIFVLWNIGEFQTFRKNKTFASTINMNKIFASFYPI